MERMKPQREAMQRERPLILLDSLERQGTRDMQRALLILLALLARIVLMQEGRVQMKQILKVQPSNNDN